MNKTKTFSLILISIETLMTIGLIGACFYGWAIYHSINLTKENLPSASFPSDFHAVEFLDQFYSNKEIVPFVQSTKLFKTGKWHFDQHVHMYNVKIGDRFEFRIPAAKSKRAALKAYFSSSATYPEIEVYVDGKWRGAQDLYSSAIENKIFDLGPAPSPADGTIVIVEVTGKNDAVKTNTFHMGIDGFAYIPY